MPPALPLLGGGYAVLETLAAGALAGLVTETLMHPLDTVSHRARVHPRCDYGSLLGPPTAQFFTILYLSGAPPPSLAGEVTRRRVGYSEVGSDLG
jgi:hypothetical protein